MIVDETDLLPERGQKLLAGLSSSVSAKVGGVFRINVSGDRVGADAADNYKDSEVEDCMDGADPVPESRDRQGRGLG